METSKYKRLPVNPVEPVEYNIALFVEPTFMTNPVIVKMVGASGCHKATFEYSKEDGAIRIGTGNWTST